MAWAAPFPQIDGGARLARLKRLRRLAWIIDGAFKLPGPHFRFGLNSIIGLVPIGGNALLGLISAYIIFEAAQLGVPGPQLARMLANVALEVAGGSGDRNL